MKTKTIALLLAGCVPAVTLAQTIGAPTLKQGDTWTYVETNQTGPTGWRQTHNALTVQRVTDSHIYISAKPVGANTDGNEILVNADWSRVREIAGSPVVVNRPFAFPLQAGKTWQVDFTEPHPNKKLDSATWTTKYKVVGYEDVEVPAGKFHALKIEAEGTWKGQLAASNTIVQAAQTVPGQTTLVTQAHRMMPGATAGSTYKAFWYAPEVGRWVKSVEEYYGSNGVRTQRLSSELESYKVGG